MNDDVMLQELDETELEKICGGDSAYTFKALMDLLSELFKD
jgi:hypothetical protein